MSDEADLRTSKELLRREIKARVAALDLVERSRQERTLCESLLDLPGLCCAERLLLYHPALKEEVDLKGVLRHLTVRGQVVLLPRFDRATKSLRIFRVENLDVDLVTGSLGIPEPRLECREALPWEVDWALVPGLAFDGAGYRLGRGAGCYDKLLPLLRREVPRWSVALEPQRVDHVPREPHDQPVSGVVFPSRCTF